MSTNMANKQTHSYQKGSGTRSCPVCPAQQAGPPRKQSPLGPCSRVHPASPGALGTQSRRAASTQDTKNGFQLQDTHTHAHVNTHVHAHEHKRTQAHTSLLPCTLAQVPAPPPPPFSPPHKQTWVKVTSPARRMWSLRSCQLALSGRPVTMTLRTAA